MNSFDTNWTKEELKVYILIYCSKADYVETKEEVDFIKSKTSPELYDKVHAEFDRDNDYESVQKIQSSINKHGYSPAENENLTEEIKGLFMADGDFGTLEQNLFIGMKRIFNLP